MANETDIAVNTLTKLVTEISDQCKNRRASEDNNIRRIKGLLDGGLKDSMDAGLRRLGKKFAECCPQTAGIDDGNGDG